MVGVEQNLYTTFSKALDAFVDVCLKHTASHILLLFLEPYLSWTEIICESGMRGHGCCARD
jgi:hypothetical protein